MELQCVDLRNGINQTTATANETKKETSDYSEKSEEKKDEGRIVIQDPLALEKFMKEHQAEENKFIVLNTLIETAEENYQKNELKVSLSLYEQALQMFLSTNQGTKPSILWAKILNNTAVILLELSRLDGALSYSQKAVQMFEILKIESSLELANSLETAAIILQNFGFLNESLEKFKKALHILRNFKEVPPSRIQKCLKWIASILVCRRDFTQALSVYEEVLKLSKIICAQDPYDTIDSLLRVGNVLEHLNQPGMAIGKYEEAFLMLQKIHNNKHTDVSDCLIKIGYILISLERDDEALKSFEDALKIQKDLTSDNIQKTNAVVLNLIGDVYFRRKDFETAYTKYCEANEALSKDEALLKSAKLERQKTKEIRLQEIATEVKEKKLTSEEEKEKRQEIIVRENQLDFHQSVASKMSQVTVLSRLAVVNVHLLKPEKAAQSYEMLTEIMEELSIYEIRLGTICQFECIFENALDVFQKAIHAMMKQDLNLITSHSVDFKDLKDSFAFFKWIQANLPENIDEKNQLQIAMHLKNVAIIFLSRSFFVEAKWCLDRAVAMIIVKNRDSAILADCLNHLTTTYRDLGFFSEALNWIEQAVEINQKIRPSKMSTAISLNKKGNILYELSQFKKAEEVIRKALAIGLKNESSLIATFWDNLGNLYREISKYEEAKKSHLQAQSIRGNNAYSYSKLALLFIECDMQKNALENFQKAFNLTFQELQIALSIFQTDNLAINLLDDCSYFVGSFGRAIEAIEYLKIIVKLRETKFNKNHFLTGKSFFYLGVYYERAGKYVEALENYQKAHDILLNIEKPPLMAVIKANMGNCCLYLNRTDKRAQTFFENSLQFNRKILGEIHPNVATSYEHLGNYWFRVKEYKNAKENYTKALKIITQVYPENHGIVLLCKSHITCCENALNNNEINRKGNQPLLSPKEVKQIIQYINNYLAQNIDLKIEKKSGFSYFHLPLDDLNVKRISSIRICYWPKKVDIEETRDLQSFISNYQRIIIAGNYTYSIYKPSNKLTDDFTPFITYRIMIGHSKEKSTYKIGDTDLVFMEQKEAKKKSIVSIFTDLAYQITKINGVLVSVDCFFKGEQSKEFYDVFLPQNAFQGQRENGNVFGIKKTSKIALEIKKIFESYK